MGVTPGRPGISFNLGHGMAFLSAVIFAFYVVLIRQKSAYGGNAVAVAFLISAFVFLALSAVFEPSWTWEPVTLLFVAAAGSAGIGSRVLWNFGAQYGDVRLLAKWAACVPLLAVAGLILFGKSPLEVSTVAGAVLIFAAVAVLSAVRNQDHP